MRYLLPLVASSALAAALPQVKTVIDTVVVTATQYVEESAPTGTSDQAIPYFPAPAAPSVAYSAAPVAPVVASSPAPVAAQAAAVPSKQVGTPKPAQASTPAYTSTAAAAAPSNPGSKDGQSTQGQGTSQSISSSDSILAIMTNAQVESIVHTCWNGAIPWPIPNTPLPCVDVVAPQLSLFPRPAATANTLTINNHCGYDIYYSHLGSSTNAPRGSIKAGSSIQQPLDGTLVRASKTPAFDNMDGYEWPSLVEYSVSSGQVFYDLSLITCIKDGDTSNCVGHEAGLQLGGPNAKTFQCAPGAWCDDQVYMYQENLCKKQNPVSATSTSNGLTVDFCASQNK